MSRDRVCLRPRQYVYSVLTWERRVAGRFSRRDFLRASVAAGVGFGVVAGGSQGFYKTKDLIEQHETWQEASRPNREFLSRHGGALARLTLGGSFAPEQFGFGPDERRESLA